MICPHCLAWRAESRADWPPPKPGTHESDLPHEMRRNKTLTRDYYEGYMWSQANREPKRKNLAW